MNALARGVLVIAATGLLLAGGCRSSADRIRVLEAERADAERRNMELKNKNATTSAQLMEVRSQAEREEAQRRALEMQLELLNREREQAGPTDVVPAPGVDIDRLRSRLGPDAEVHGRQDGGVSIVLASDITFRPGRADLNERAETTLARVVRALKQTENVRSVRIEGHTDSDPIRKSGWTDNRALSLARAERVRAYLANNGVNEGILSVEGRGAEEPVVSNATPEGKAQNRRVEIILASR